MLFPDLRMRPFDRPGDGAYFKWMGINRRSWNAGAFSLLELLITMVLIATLVTLLGATFGKFRDLSNRTYCMNNLRNIYIAMVNYYADREQLPNAGKDEDGDPCDLRVDLKSYGTVSKTFDCPADKDNTQPNSYQPFYIQLQAPVAGHSYVLSCPRHSKELATVVAFADSSILVHTSAPVTDGSNNPIKPGQEVQQSKIKFADSSEAQVVQDIKLRVVASFRIGDQLAYSVMSVNTDDLGQFRCDVTSGSQFDVATPSAVIGVHGTRFLVKTSKPLAPETSVMIQQGTVRVTGLPKAGDVFLRPGPSGDRCKAIRGQGIQMDVF